MTIEANKMGKIFHWRFIAVSLCWVGLVVASSPSFAQKEPRYDIAQLANEANIVIVGFVESVTERQSFYDQAAIRVVAVLKGKVDVDTMFLSFPARPNPNLIRPPRSFRIAERASLVLFLKALEGTEAIPVAPGSFALFPIPTYMGQ